MWPFNYFACLMWQRYRMSHKKMTFGEYFECLLRSTVLDIKEFLQFKIFLLELYFIEINVSRTFLLYATFNFFLVSNNLTNYGRRHFKLCFVGHPVFYEAGTWKKTEQISFLPHFYSDQGVKDFELWIIHGTLWTKTNF